MTMNLRRSSRTHERDLNPESWSPGRGRDRERGPGRPPQGAALVEGVECSDHAKERLRVIFGTISGSMTIAEACAVLGVGESRFHAMRSDFIRESAQLLEPRAPGPAPKARADAEATRRIEALERENARLALEARAERARAELALAMPERLQAIKKKGAPPEATQPVKRRWKERKRKIR